MGFVCVCACVCVCVPVEAGFFGTSDIYICWCVNVFRRFSTRACVCAHRSRFFWHLWYVYLLIRVCVCVFVCVSAFVHLIFLICLCPIVWVCVFLLYWVIFSFSLSRTWQLRKLTTTWTWLSLRPCSIARSTLRACWPATNTRLWRLSSIDWWRPRWHSYHFDGPHFHYFTMLLPKMWWDYLLWRVRLDLSAATCTKQLL